MTSKIELLAPAKNIQCAKSAIIFGADAVYIGPPSFGARKNASNSIEDIKELVEFAHKFDVKIYVTLNTILTDEELKEAKNLIYQLYEIGVDALIIQDMAILELDLPPIELHMSTQSNIRTLEKVKFFEKLGIKRVVLARELSLQQIKEIAQNTNIELECFIQGALCVSYSGQCYMSASIGGRSANRGECAQSCRKKYSLIDENGKVILKDKYLLSLKDFCAEEYLDELIKIGVKSFKIEGRLKDENYVKNNVLYYRKLFEKYETTSAGIVEADIEPDLSKTFNRGFTTYFLKKADEIFNFDTPKSVGQYIGTVEKTFKNSFLIKTKKILKEGDGLYFISNDEPFGCYVNKNENNKIYPNKLPLPKKGAKVYRNFDINFEKQLKNSKTKRFIETKVFVEEGKISVTDGKNKVETEFSSREYSNNPEKMKTNFIKCFEKSGESIFASKEIVFSGDKIPFLPISELNKIRRKLYSLLEEKRKNEYKRNFQNEIFYTEYLKEPLDYRLNIHNKKAFEFYKKCGVEPKEYSLETSKNFKNKELMRTKHCLRRALCICLKNDKTKKELYLVDDACAKYSLTFDCKNCEMVIKQAK